MPSFSDMAILTVIFIFLTSVAVATPYLSAEFQGSTGVVIDTDSVADEIDSSSIVSSYDVIVSVFKMYLWFPTSPFSTTLPSALFQGFILVLKLIFGVLVYKLIRGIGT